MPYQLIYFDEVPSDIQHAKAWYKEIRIAHAGKFPYNIHFFIDEPKKMVVITGIIHNKRDLADGRRGQK